MDAAPTGKGGTVTEIEERMLTQQKGRCPTFVGNGDCKPLAASVVFGARLYCNSCWTVMARAVARHVQQQAEA
jgi:hypothetical protein